MRVSLSPLALRSLEGVCSEAVGRVGGVRLLVLLAVCVCLSGFVLLPEFLSKAECRWVLSHHDSLFLLVALLLGLANISKSDLGFPVYILKCLHLDFKGLFMALFLLLSLPSSKN